MTLTLASALAATVLAQPPADGPVTLAVAGRANATPWVAADGADVAVAWGGSADGKADVFVAVSRDGGRSFAAPVRVNRQPGTARLGGELPPRVALLRRSADAPEIAVLWTARAAGTGIMLARSRDGGKTFGDASALQSAGAAGDRGWPALALDARGTAHAIWLDHRGLAGGSGAHHKSAGDDGMSMAEKSAVRYAASGAAGVRVTDQVLASSVCYCCKTALAVGSDGALFAAWRHVYEGNLRDIAFAVSRDGGRRFAAPVRLSHDDWAIDGCPDDGPALAVDGSGTVHAIWPTVVKGAGGPEGALFYASSRDGRAFSPRVRVPTLGTGKPSHPQIAAATAGRIVVAWDEVEHGKRAAMVREVKPSGAAVQFGPSIRLPGETASYPVLAVSARGLLAVWTTGGAASTVRVAQLALP